jgi:hypothetical protein
MPHVSAAAREFYWSTFGLYLSPPANSVLEPLQVWKYCLQMANQSRRATAFDQGRRDNHPSLSLKEINDGLLTPLAKLALRRFPWSRIRP